VGIGEDYAAELAAGLRARGCGPRRVGVGVGRQALLDRLRSLLGWCGSLELALGTQHPMVTVRYGPVAVLGYPLRGEEAALVASLWDATREVGMAAALLEGVRGFCASAGCSVRAERLPSAIHLATAPDCAYCPYAFVALSSLAWATGVALTVYCLSGDVEGGIFTAEDVAAAFASATGVEPRGVPLVVAGGREVVGAPADPLAAAAYYLYELGAVTGFGSARALLRALAEAGVIR